MDNKTISEVWQMIDFATTHGAKVTNDKGERVKVDRSDTNNLKCYVRGLHYYLSSVDNDHVLFFDGKPYNQWHEEKVFELE